MSNPFHVLVVDNDAPTDRALRSYLALNGYLITALRGLGDALSKTARLAPDLVLFRTEASSLVVAEMCRKLCLVAPWVGIVVVTAAGYEEDKIRVL